MPSRGSVEGVRRRRWNRAPTWPIRSGERHCWTDGSYDAFAFDLTGNQVFSCNRLRANGNASKDQFGRRNIIEAGHAFWEGFIGCPGMHSKTGTWQGNAGLQKRS